MCTRLDCQAFVVRKLGWCSVGVVDAVLGNRLCSSQQLSRPYSSLCYWAYVIRCKDHQGSSLCKEAVCVDGVTNNSIDLEALSVNATVSEPYKHHTVSPLKGRHTTAR